MDQLKLKYVIDLVSNISAKSRSDAHALAESQKKIQAELEKTKGEVGLLERALLNVGRVGSASADRQAAYLSRLALQYTKVRTAAEAATKAMQTAAGVGAGVAAGAYATERLTRAPMDYSMRLAHMTNTAFSGNESGWKTGRARIEKAIQDAVRRGGGTKEDAAEALDTAIASGAFSIDEAIARLPEFLQSATASGSTAKGMTSIGIAGARNFKLTGDKVRRALGIGHVGGQEGGFELKNMEKWLPEQMAMGGNLGMSGLTGFAKLVAMNQAAMFTAGSQDAAGTNLRDLLMELNTPHFKGFLAKEYLNSGADLKKGEKKKKLADLDSIFLDYQSQGVDKVDATLDIMDKVMARNEGYVALKAKLQKTSGTDERRTIMEAMAQQMQGTSVGNVFHNQQSLMAFVALQNNRDYVQKVQDRAMSDTGSLDRAFVHIADEPGFKKQQRDAEVSFAADKAFAEVAPAFNAVNETAVDLAREFPTLTTATVGATGALGVFSAALAGSGLVSLLVGGAGAGIMGRLAGMIGLGGGAVMAGAAVIPGLVPAALLAGGTYAAWEAGGYLKNLWDERNAGSAAGYRGKGFVDERLKLTAPGFNSQGIEPGRPTEIKVGEGKIDVLVRLQDDRTTVSPTVTQQLPLARLDAGATNPGGYGR